MKILISHEFFEIYRGLKDFNLGIMLSGINHTKIYLLMSTIFSPSDLAIYSKVEIKKKTDELCKKYHFTKLTYSGILIKRRKHNLIIPFLLPNIFTYLLKLIIAKPDYIIDAIYPTLTPRSYLNFFYSRIFKKKLYLIDSGDEGRNKRIFPFEMRVFRYATKIFSYNEAGIQRIKSKYNVKTNNFFKYYKQLDVNNFICNRKIKTKLTIGYVGRLLSIKGFNKFIEISNKLRDDFNFVVSGENTDNFIIPDWINYYDYISNDKISDIYNQIDFLIIPDLNDCKGYPTVVLEALLCGCIVCVGFSYLEFFTSTKFIFFYNPSDINSILKYLDNYKNSFTNIYERHSKISKYYHEKVKSESLFNLLKDELV